MSEIAATRQLQCADKQRAALYISTKTSSTSATARRVNTGGLLSRKQSQTQCKGTRQTWRRRVYFTRCIWGQSLRFLVHRKDEQRTTPLCNFQVALEETIAYELTVAGKLSVIWSADTYLFIFLQSKHVRITWIPPSVVLTRCLQTDKTCRAAHKYIYQQLAASLIWRKKNAIKNLIKTGKDQKNLPVTAGALCQTHTTVLLSKFLQILLSKHTGCL